MMLDPTGLLAVAEAAVDAVEPVLLNGLGAQPARHKSGGSFATEVDLAIESQLNELLVQLTGIPVYGEEFGGSAASLDDTAWIVDPIDGTANYSAGSPLCGLLLALVHQGKPVVAVASFPFLAQRLAAAEGMKLRVVSGLSGSRRPQLDPHAQDSRGHVGCSTHLSGELYEAILDQGLRPRMTGCVGLDAAFVAQGIFEGAINFSPHPWDNAAGALLVKSAGGVVTDLDGSPWSVRSSGLIAGTPRVHAQLMRAVNKFDN